jgi:hypothetical protein
MADTMGRIFDLNRLENLAIRETGRIPVSKSTCESIIHVYPVLLTDKDILCQRGRKAKFEEYYFPVDINGPHPFGNLRSLLTFLSNLHQLLAVIRTVDIYFFDIRRDIYWALAAVILARFLGKFIILHDYSFRRIQTNLMERILHSAVDEYEVLDEIEFADYRYLNAPLSFRIFNINRKLYTSCRKSKAVPRVLVYGDLGRASVRSLALKSFNLVKAKYPRTEFTFINPLETESPAGIDHPVIQLTFSNESQLSSIFEEHDILLLLTQGGVNRYFASRAARAGYPIITNGFNISVTGDTKRSYSPAIRDSYSSIADEIIRLVEDEDYYRSFA